MVSLDKLLQQNKWWTKGSDFWTDDVDFSKYNSLTVHIDRREPSLAPGKIVVIKGPRRVGKTMSIKLAIKNLIDHGNANPDDILYLSFDEAISPKEMESTVRNFINKPHSGVTYVFLDEIQSVKGWEGALLGLANSGLLKNTAVVITGSIAHFFSPETLPGRGMEGNIYYLRTADFRTFVLALLNPRRVDLQNLVSQRIGYPFTSQELKMLYDCVSKNEIDLEEDSREIYKKVSEVERYFIPISKLVELYIYSGGYPVSINNRLFDTKVAGLQIYEEIYNYIKNDAATITKRISGDPMKADKAIAGILDYVGKKVSYSKMARNSGMNKATLIDYFGRLENSFVFLNIGGVKITETGLLESKVKKFYFSDVFMHYSAGAAKAGKTGDVFSKEVVNSSNVGTIVEEITAGHLVRVKEQDGMKPYETYLKFYDVANRGEIDFLYKRDNSTVLGIEVKYQNDASVQDIKKVKNIEEYLLLTKSSEVSKRGECLTVPIALFLVMLKSSKFDL